MTTELPHDEIFVNDDGSPDVFWMLAEGRTAVEALQRVDSITTLDGGCTVERVTGLVEQTPDGPYVHVDPEGDLELWQVIVG